MAHGTANGLIIQKERPARTAPGMVEVRRLVVCSGNFPSSPKKLGKIPARQVISWSINSNHVNSGLILFLVSFPRPFPSRL